MTVIPDKHTFTIWKGATFFEILTLYETMDKNTPRNLSGYTAEMIIRKQPNDEVNKYLTLATVENNDRTNGCQIILPTELQNRGQIRLEITPAVTKTITWKSAVYDLTITGPNGTDALLYGGIKVNGV